MKAAVFKALGQPLTIEDVADPTPGPGEVIVEVARCGICGSDLHMTEDPFFDLPPGSVLGHEYAGEVVALGKGVDRVKVGDRVAVLPLSGCWQCASCLAGEPAWCARMRLEGGGYGEYARVSQHQCLRLPCTVTTEDGALVEPLAVGLHGVTLANLTPGDRVLIVGAGPIGLAATFWCQKLGASRIAVTAASNRREALAYRMGATAFIDSAERTLDSVLDALGGPPDVVFECVGKPGVLETCIEYVRPRGAVVILGLCTARDAFLPFNVVAKEVRLHGSAFYTRRDFEVAADTLDADPAAPHAMITETVALAHLPEAFEALRHRTSQCKVLVKPG